MAVPSVEKSIDEILDGEPFITYFFLKEGTSNPRTLEIGGL